MIPIEAHLVLNHLPIVGLTFGLVFFVAGLRRSSDSSLRAGLRIFLTIGIAILPVVGSGLVSARVLAKATWLDSDVLNDHRLAGIVTLVVLVGLAGLCGAVLVASRNSRAMSARARKPVLPVAIAGLMCAFWTAYLGGSLRHDELGRTRRSPPVSGVVGQCSGVVGPSSA